MNRNTPIYLETPYVCGDRLPVTSSLNNHLQMKIGRIMSYVNLDGSASTPLICTASHNCLLGWRHGVFIDATAWWSGAVGDETRGPGDFTRHWGGIGSPGNFGAELWGISWGEHVERKEERKRLESRLVTWNNRYSWGASYTSSKREIAPYMYLHFMFWLSQFCHEGGLGTGVGV